MPEPFQLAVQYFRPPFPEPREWERDLDEIVALGVDAIQLWLTWGWIEATPGRYDFADYDTIIAAAAERGLGVVLSTIAEVQPFWIHRVVPDSALINQLGQPVPSGTRRENNVGLTPGGCWDHPEIARRLADFITACGDHFAAADNLILWDVWNETRWAVHADSHVCYCPHTQRRFRGWLRERHGDLAGLNQAWRRRYSDWADVRPGLAPARTYSDLVEFERFLTWRAGQHMGDRARALRRGDPHHRVAGHAISPSPYFPGQRHEQALSRGDDWDHVEHLDAYGLSMYPDFQLADPAEFAGRANATRQAAGSRPFWIAELEAAPTGVGWQAGRPVTGADVRGWIWESVAYGAAGAILWQWYDERIGEESASFGLAGRDRDSVRRRATVRRVGRELAEAAPALTGYRPDPGSVALLWDQGGYQLDWAQQGPKADLVSGSVRGYALLLERLHVPYRMLATNHLTAELLAGVRVVILPAPLVVSPVAAAVLEPWVNNGGTLLTEPELDGWTEEGILREPADRPFATALGAPHGPRSPLTGPAAVDLGDDHYTFAGSHWLQWMRQSDASESLLDVTSQGGGRVITIGTFAGAAHFMARQDGLSALVRQILTEADALPAIAIAGPDGVRSATGRSPAGRLIFLFNDEPRDAPVSLTLPSGLTDVSAAVAGDVAIAEGADTASATFQVSVPATGLAALIAT